MIEQELEYHKTGALFEGKWMTLKFMIQRLKGKKIRVFEMIEIEGYHGICPSARLEISSTPEVDEQLTLFASSRKTRNHALILVATIGKETDGIQEIQNKRVAGIMHVGDLETSSDRS